MNRVNHEALIFSVLMNATNDEHFYKAGKIVGFFQPVPEEDILEHGLHKARIDEVFLDFSREPKYPVPGACAKELTEDERKFLEDNLVINAPEVQLQPLSEADDCSAAEPRVSDVRVKTKKFFLRFRKKKESLQFIR